MNCHLLSAKGLDRAEFVRCIRETFQKQYVNGPGKGEAILDLVFGDKPCQLTGISVEEHLGIVISTP